MRRYDARVPRALAAVGLTADCHALLRFVARQGWTAQPDAWRSPVSPAPWSAAWIIGPDGTPLGVGADPGSLERALAAAVVAALERFG